MVIHPFWYICLSVRILLILLIRILDKQNFKKLGMLILSIMGLGFIYQALFSNNKEIQFNKVFWHDTRILHGVLYLLSVYYLHLNKLDMNSLVLALDIIFSVLYRFYFRK
jgi:hypothetical protein